MKSIAQPVGRNGTNSIADVKLVQLALNAHRQELTPLVVDGLSGPKTIAAIEEFQNRVVGMVHPDGRVDPEQQTFKALARAPSPEQRADWSGDSSKWSEEQKLSSMNSQLRSKVIALLETLRSQGHQPKIFFAWRSLSVQAELKRQGRTTVDFSFHNASRAGRPNAFAADIIDSRYGWIGPEANSFFEALGREAKSVNLYWGGDWVSFQDLAHVQLYPNSLLANVRSTSTELVP